MTIHRADCKDCQWSFEDGDFAKVSDEMERHARKEVGHYVELERAVATDGGRSSVGTDCSQQSPATEKAVGGRRWDARVTLAGAFSVPDWVSVWLIANLGTVCHHVSREYKSVGRFDISPVSPTQIVGIRSATAGSDRSEEVTQRD